ncbi:MAG: tetratricopeptide repeat protein [Candidatus Brocadiia bacterium]
MSQAPERPRASRRFLPAALIVAAVLLAYAPVFRAGFIWDDDKFLTENPLIHAPDGLYRFWFTAEPPDYFPLTSSMLWFEWRLWGPNAFGYHLVNVLLHAASAVLLWRVLLRLKVPGAWLAGLLFAVHPVAVESVAWITERKNTLPMVFYLASILAYLRFEDGCSHHDDTTDGNPQYLFSLGLFLLALLAKTSVVMLPAVLLLCAWWRRGKVTARDLLRMVPFFALSLALGLVTVWFQWHNAIGHEMIRTEGAASRVAGAGWIVWFYLYKILLPAGLCAAYPLWEVDGSSVLCFLPIALLAATTALLWAGRRRWGSGPLVAWAYFMVLLLPVLGFVEMTFMELSLVADHLQYAAMPGILALAAGLLACVMERPGAPARRSPREGRWRPVAVAAAGALVLACAALTFCRTFVYHDEETLWRDTLAKNPKAWIAKVNLSDLLLRRATAPGADSAALLAEAGRYRQEAIRNLDQAIVLRPDDAQAYLDRGNIQVEARRYAEGIYDYDQAIALKPDYVAAWYNRGNSYFSAGRSAEALRDLDQAIALNPDFAEAYVNRANIHAAAGRYDEALRDYDRAIALKPAYAAAWFHRGNVYAKAGRPEEALRDLDQAIELRPGYAEEWFIRGNVYAKAGHPEDALRDLDQAIALKPDYAEAYVNRGIIHASAGRQDQALRDYDQAIACNPRNADAWYNRGNVHLAAGRPAEAVLDFSRAIELRPRDADAYFNRAVARHRMKQDREALADLLTVRQLGGTVPEELLRSLGQPAQPTR